MRKYLEEGYRGETGNETELGRRDRKQLGYKIDTVDNDPNPQDRNQEVERRELDMVEGCREEVQGEIISTATYHQSL